MAQSLSTDRDKAPSQLDWPGSLHQGLHRMQCPDPKQEIRRGESTSPPMCLIVLPQTPTSWTYRRTGWTAAPRLVMESKRKGSRSMSQTFVWATFETK